jgi:hypothetical protein
MRGPLPGIKSLFASFSSEKEESSSFEKKKQKNFCSWRANATCISNGIAT